MHGRLLRMPGERQRTLLALLLAHPNELVLADQLADALFGEEQAATATNAIQVAASRLRRTLTNSSDLIDDLLVTRPRGYELCVSPGSLDALRFEQLASEGRTALASGDMLQAGARLRAALALWRGPALADFGGVSALQPHARRLDQLRLAALMDRMDAELALGAGAELVGELDVLVAEHPLQERLRGQLMRALYRAGRQVDALEVFRRGRRHLREEFGLEPGRALPALELAILRHEPDLEAAEIASASHRRDDRVGVCPFKGLTSYTLSDAPYFFGRERIVADLVARVAVGGLVGIFGASGAGKSSVLRAGLLHAVADGAIPGSDGWRSVVMRPGSDPMANLERAIGNERVADALREVLPEGRVMLIVDQLEEAFVVEDGTAPFFDALADAALDPEGRFVVVVALRADMYGRCAEHPRFASLLSANHVLLGPMERDELARAIEHPATAVGLGVEPRLVDAIVADVADAPGALPLVSTMLLELWRRRDGQLLLLESYRASGGVRAAVARLGEDAYRRLSEPDQSTARTLLLRLTEERDGTVFRRRLPIDDFDDHAAHVVAMLAHARLLTLSDGAVEVSHEALLREWPRIAEWLDEDRDGRQLHAHLETSSREWDTHGRDPADLYRGARLASALDWAGRHTAELAPTEREFLASSRVRSEGQLRAERHRNRRLRVLLACLAGLLLAAVAAGAVALDQRGNARSEARTALAQQLGAQAVIEPRIDTAMLLAREAVNLRPTLQTEGRLLATLERAPGVIATFTVPITDRPQAVEVSPDGRTIAVATNNNVMRFFDTRTHRQTHTARMTPYSYAYIPRTNDLIAAPPGPLPYELIDARTSRVLHTYQLGHLWNTTLSGFVEPLTVTPDGHTVFLLWAAQRPDGSDGPAYIQRWSVARGGAPLVVPMHASGMFAATVTHDGLLVVATDRKISTWNTQTMRQLSSIPIPRISSAVVNAAISPDGTTFAYGLADGTVHFIDVSSGRVTDGLGAHAAPVQHVIFSPDSGRAVSAGDDGVIIVWNPRTGDPVERLAGHAGRVLGLDFTRDGSTLYSASLDGTVLQWDLTGGRGFGDDFHIARRTTALAATASSGPPLAISPTGRALAMRTSTSSIGVFSTASLRMTATVALAATDRVGATAWAGKQLVVGSGRGTIGLWDSRVSRGSRTSSAVSPGTSERSRRAAQAVASRPSTVSRRHPAASGARSPSGTTDDWCAPGPGLQRPAMIWRSRLTARCLRSPPTTTACS